MCARNAKHHTNSSVKLYKVIYSSQHSLNVMYSRFNRHDISDDVTNSADRLYRPAHHKDYISPVEEECPHVSYTDLYIG